MKALFPAIRSVRLSVVLLALCAPALAQEPVTSPAEDVHEQMRNLIVQIEVGLKRVDGLLWSADARPSEGAESSLATRLAAARETSRKVLNDIDTLLEIRHHPHPGGGGGS
jgi:hypothetical protein